MGPKDSWLEFVDVTISSNSDENNDNDTCVSNVPNSLKRKEKMHKHKFSKQNQGVWLVS